MTGHPINICVKSTPITYQEQTQRMITTIVKTVDNLWKFLQWPLNGSLNSGFKNSAWSIVSIECNMTHLLMDVINELLSVSKYGWLKGGHQIFTEVLREPFSDGWNVWTIWLIDVCRDVTNGTSCFVTSFSYCLCILHFDTAHLNVNVTFPARWLVWVHFGRYEQHSFNLIYISTEENTYLWNAILICFIKHGKLPRMWFSEWSLQCFGWWI